MFVSYLFICSRLVLLIYFRVVFRLDNGLFKILTSNVKPICYLPKPHPDITGTERCKRLFGISSLESFMSLHKLSSVPTCALLLLLFCSGTSGCISYLFFLLRDCGLDGVAFKIAIALFCASLVGVVVHWFRITYISLFIFVAVKKLRCVVIRDYPG